MALLDVNLRGELVTPVAEALRAQDVPFVLASAYDSRGLTAVAALAEVPNVGKPTDERRLLAALAQAVARERAAGRRGELVETAAGATCQSERPCEWANS